MSERWVIGIDGSFGSRTALEWALQQSERRDAELVAVHAYGTSIQQRARALVGGGDERESGAATAMSELDAAIVDIVEGRRVERVVADGHAAKAILSVADDADLVIVGRHGSGGGWHDVMGSMSRFCVTHAHVPTVVVPTDWNRQEPRRIIVGYDGSEDSARAVRWSVGFAPPDADVRAVIAIEIAPWLQPDIVALRFSDELEAEERRLRDALDETDPTGLVERDVVVRGARPALASAAADADLVVLGRRGAGALQSMIVGSVSTWMLDAAPTPIAVIPHGSTPPREES